MWVGQGRRRHASEACEGGSGASGACIRGMGVGQGRRRHASEACEGGSAASEACIRGMGVGQGRRRHASEAWWWVREGRGMHQGRGSGPGPLTPHVH